jgi:hypothetical protein
MGSWAAWALVLIALVVFDLEVRGKFFDSYVMPRYVASGLLPRERTNGHVWRTIFDGLARIPRPKVRMGVVGDSTVHDTGVLGDDKAPVYFMAQALQRRLPNVTVGGVDVSEIGLYANDAALVVNKLIAADVDVIVYGLTLRALPAISNAHWSTNLGYELSPLEMLRVTSVGGGAWLWDSISGAQVLGSAIQSVWAAYGYRAILKRFVWERAVAPKLQPWPAVMEATRPDPFAPPKIGVPKDLLPGKVDWSRAGFAIPNSNWDAIEIIASLCERYAPERCLIYSGPINPDGRDRLADPGLYEEYLARLRGVMERHGVRFHDFSDALAATDFRKPMFPRPGEAAPRDPIHLNPDGGAKLGDVVAEAVAALVAPKLAALELQR